MSVCTAWEIAALEDVRLAPSPRQQRPAPGPVRAASLLLTLPGPPAKDPGAAGRGGPHPQPGPCSPALGCSNSAPPRLPLLGHRWAGAWVSLRHSMFPPHLWVILARAGRLCHSSARAGSLPLCLSLRKPRRPLERGLSPLCHQGLGCHRAQQVGVWEGGPRPHCSLSGPCSRSSSQLKPAVQ